VKNAPVLKEVLSKLDDFLAPYKNKRIMVLNDCDADIRYFLRHEIKPKNIWVKDYLLRYINLK